MSSTRARVRVPGSLPLSDRAGFLAALGRHAGGDRSLAVMCLDLDRFRQVNAAFGHGFGDAVLRAVGIRLRTGVPDAVAVAHLGGASFAVALPVVDADAADATAGRLRELLLAPLRLGDGPSVRVTGRVGVALFPDDGREPTQLLNRADIAASHAREAMDGDCQRYVRAMERRPREQQELLLALHDALEQDQLSLAFQPKLRLADRSYAGAEVLARWLSPTLGDVPPGRFVPVAEEAGIIQAIGEFAFARVAGLAGEWAREGLAVGRLALNVSAAQLGHEDFVERVADLLAAARGVEFDLEITESAVVTRVQTVARSLGQVRALGATVTLDDFGTGYSSFSHLKHLPIDAIKIAPDFLVGLAADAPGQRLVAAIVAMARTLDLRVVAEGIETEQQAGFLAAAGCHEGQGFLFARPMPAGEFAGWLRDRAH
ncbi:MAG: bifunctional diguanylate cyclase/phosphodiesterase [Xanthomonadales bacterium]|nr:bifunctional diguanylate cyclase/phosphodiesterase [Xanthomonadales bacterium]